VADARRDVDPDRLGHALVALSAAGRARLLDHRAAAVAARARLGDREHALALGLDPAAVALRADLRAGARLGARAATGRARLRGGQAQRHLRAVYRLLEAERDLGLDVGAALGTGAASGAAPAAGPAEQVGEDVRQRPEVAEAAGEPARLAAGEHAAAVVLLALLGVADQVVGGLDLLEALLGLLISRVAVRVVLAREL